MLIVAGFGTIARAREPQLFAPEQAHSWQRVEFRLEGMPAVENPFDPDQIRVDATFTAPSGATHALPAFWYQEYARSIVDGAEVLAPVGGPGWRLRFTPTEVGEHRVVVATSVSGQAMGAPVEARFAVADATPGGQHGWVRVAPDPRWLETSDGRPLRLVGENVCWGYGRDTYEYDEWFGAMHASGQNFARLWMSPWSIGLEHGPGTLNRYSLGDAWQLDHVFELAERLGIYLLIAFDHHGMFFVDDGGWGGTNNFWRGNNPYSAELGGPCAGPNDFFTEPAAREIYRKRLRYLVARYGYSPHLLAWQFFNEIDNAYAPRGRLQGNDVVAWHREMGRWFRANDPFRHLVTTSLTGSSDRPALWELPEMDLTMYHSYNEPAPARRLAAVSQDFVRRYGKPVMIGEFGVNSRGWDLAADPYLRGFRQGLWGGALGGSVGSGMSWWWEAIHEDDAYPLYAAMTGILRRAGWYEGGWTPIAFPEAGAAPESLGGVAGDAAMFTARIQLNTGWRAQAGRVLTVRDPLAAERAAETVSAYVQGAGNAHMGTAIQLATRVASGARLVLHVNSVGSGAELVIRVDGVEALREAIPDTDGRTAISGEIDREFAVPLEAGLRRIEVANAGIDWFFLDSLRIERVLAETTGDGGFGPETIGLRQGNRAVLYVVSPWAVFPAGSRRYHPPVQTGTVTLPTWPAGTYRVEWFDTRTGAPAGLTEGIVHAAAGDLPLPLPPFRDDLAGIVEAMPAGSQ